MSIPDSERTSDAPSLERYAVNEASIVFDVLEGEVVLVNLDSGSYYILEGTASAIWQMLIARHRVSEIVGTLSRHYTGDVATMESAVGDFVGQLVQEALLVAAPVDAQAAAFDESQLGGGSQPFSAPVMYRYTDMQALIQMDPIREYDETGWPRRPTPPPPRTA
jgi:hypothetical protein